jgi:hypothetical protein
MWNWNTGDKVDAISSTNVIVYKVYILATVMSICKGLTILL